MHAAFWCSEHRWIYIKATMNLELQCLLTLTPGIIFYQPHLSPVKFPVSCDDFPTILSIPTAPMDNLQVGDCWACIIKGAYWGDIGLVAEVGEWIKPLVIPCLWLPVKYISQDLSKKCKHSGHIPLPFPMLFDPIQFATSCKVILTQTKWHSYQYCIYFIEYCLLLRDFNHCTFSS